MEEETLELSLNIMCKVITLENISDSQIRLFGFHSREDFVRSRITLEYLAVGTVKTFLLALDERIGELS
jgi:hypothetical protein